MMIWVIEKGKSLRETDWPHIMRCEESTYVVIVYYGLSNLRRDEPVSLLFGCQAMSSLQNWFWSYSKLLDILGTNLMYIPTASICKMVRKKLSMFMILLLFHFENRCESNKVYVEKQTNQN